MLQLHWYAYELTQVLQIHYEEVVLFNVVSLAPTAKILTVYATTTDPCIPAVNASTHAAAGSGYRSEQ
jgi:hypothetical protein